MLFDRSTLISISSFWPRSYRDGRTKDVVQVLIASTHNYLRDTCLMFDICLDDHLFCVPCPVLESIICLLSSMQRPTIHLPSLQCFQSCWLLLITFAIYFYCCYHHYHITITTYLLLQASIFQVWLNGQLNYQSL